MTDIAEKIAAAILDQVEADRALIKSRIEMRIREVLGAGRPEPAPSAGVFAGAWFNPIPFETAVLNAQYRDTIRRTFFPAELYDDGA